MLKIYSSFNVFIPSFFQLLPALRRTEALTRIPHHPGETGIKFNIGGCNMKDSTKP